MKAIEERVRETEERTGKRIVLRGVREPDPNIRGRVTERPGHFLLEYRDDQPGYFWHHAIIHELLDCLEKGQRNVTLLEEHDEASP